MHIEEARKIIAVMMVSYPNFKPIDTEFMATTWADMLSEYTYEQVNTALRCYITTDKSGFAPAIGQIVDKIKTVSEPQQLNELEAWGLVYNAIRNSGYHADEEFAKLPPIVQKAVGSPSQLRNWGMTDIDSLETVAQSNFLRTYRVVAKREDEISRMPSQIRQMIQEREVPKIKIENNSKKNTLEDEFKDTTEIPEKEWEKLQKILSRR